MCLVAATSLVESVVKIPGATAVIPTWSEPNSRARDFVIDMIAPLLATYDNNNGAPQIAVSDAIFTTLPEPEARNSGAAARVINQVPRTFTRITLSQVFRSISSNETPPIPLAIAALLTKPSSLPSKVLATSFRRASMELGSSIST